MQLRPFPLRSFQCLGLLLSLLALPAMAQPQSTYTGILDGRLHVDANILGFAVWNEEVAAVEHKLDVPLHPGDRLFAGKLGLSSTLTFQGAIVRSQDGKDVLYLDTNRDGRFERSEAVPFYPVKAAAQNQNEKESARVEVPLASGAYKSCPLEIRLLKDGVPSPAGPKQLAVLYTDSAFVQGHARLPKRALLVRYQYNFVKNGVDLNHALEWVDVDGDGAIDVAPGSPEMLRAKGTAPVFHIGGLFLQTESVDLSKNTFVLRSVPAAEYQRIDLTVGSVLPDFEFTDFQGVKRHLSDVKGKYRLLDFWATWCHPCVADLPSLKKTYREFHARGFEVLGMDGDEITEKPQKLLGEMKITWPQARFNDDLYETKFQISQWPTMVLIDAQGKIVSNGDLRHLPLDGENLEVTLGILLPNHP